MLKMPQEVLQCQGTQLEATLSPKLKSRYTLKGIGTADKVKDRQRMHVVLALLAGKENSVETTLKKYKFREKNKEAIKGHKSHSRSIHPRQGMTYSLTGNLFVEFMANSRRESLGPKVEMALLCASKRRMGIIRPIARRRLMVPSGLPFATNPIITIRIGMFCQNI